MVSDEHAVGQQIAQLGPGPAPHDELRDEMEVGAGVDVVRDAGADDRQYGGGTLAAEIEPGEEPVASSQDELAQLALTAVIGQLDVAVLQEQPQSVPLPV
jgi:hypothetical protein